MLEAVEASLPEAAEAELPALAPIVGPIVPAAAGVADERINGFRKTTNGLGRDVWEKHITTSSGKRRRVRVVDPTGGIKTRGESCARARSQVFANRCA